MWGFHEPAWLCLGGKRSRENKPARATSISQSTRHGAWPWPELALSVHAGPLRAPQRRAGEKTRGRKRKSGQRTQKNACHTYAYILRILLAHPNRVRTYVLWGTRLRQILFWGTRPATKVYTLGCPGTNPGWLGREFVMGLKRQGTRVVQGCV